MRRTINLESIFLTFLAIAIPVGSIAAVYMATIGHRVQLTMAARIRIIEDVNHQLGFRHYTPYDDEGKQHFVIKEVSKDGIMASAGLRADDIIRFRSVDTLYKRIALHQGRRVRVPVLRSGKDLVIVVHVPHLYLREDPRKINWVTHVDIGK